MKRAAPREAELTRFCCLREAYHRGSEHLYDRRQRGTIKPSFSKRRAKQCAAVVGRAAEFRSGQIRRLIGELHKLGCLY
jgi:hypothetical protein